MNTLLSDQNLRDWLGYERPSDVEKFLKEHGINYWRTRGGKLVTTQENIQTAFGKDEIKMVRFPVGKKTQCQ